MTVAISLPSLRLSEDEETLLRKLRGRLTAVKTENAKKQAYYEGVWKAQDLGIAIPPHLRNLPVSLGWAGVVVDSRENRLDFQGWRHVTDDLKGLDEVARDNALAVESRRSHLDALVTGCGFVTLGRGGAGEPDVLVTVESSSTATCLMDPRGRDETAGLAQALDERGQLVAQTLYLPDKTVVLDQLGAVLSRDEHELGAVPMVRFVNRSSPAKPYGRSEITETVRYLVDAAARTLLGMEVAREFFTAPQRYALNADPEDFGVPEDASEAEKARIGWSVTMGRLNIIPASEDGGQPQVGQFPASPPTAYVEALRCYSQLLSAHAQLPAAYLGFVTDNPASADAIRQHEHALVKVCERAQDEFDQGWRKVGKLAALIRDGSSDPAWAKQLSCRWRDLATPTRAAAADEAQKLVASQILPADSTVTWSRIGLSQEEQDQLAQDKRRARVDQLITGLNQQAAKEQTPWQNNPANQQPNKPSQNPVPK